MKIRATKYYSGTGQVGVSIEGRSGEVLLGPFGNSPVVPDSEKQTQLNIGYHILQRDDSIAAMSKSAGVPADEVIRAVSEHIDTLSAGH